MATLNLIHLRATHCPFYPTQGIQQIVAYGHTVDEADSCPEKAKKAICSIMAELGPNTVIRELLSRLRQNTAYWGLREIRFEERERESRVIFSRYNLAELVQASYSHFGRIRGVNFPPCLPHLPLACSKSGPMERRSTFAMAACIYNKPGTIYTILNSLTGPNVGSPADAKFDLNIEYIRAEDLRIGDYYGFEVYGSYARDALKPSERNVCGIVFYGEPPKVCDKMTALGLKKREKDYVEQVWEEIYGTSQPAVDPWQFAAYDNPNFKPLDKSQCLPAVRGCPISRLVRCPTLSNSASNGDDRLRAKIYVLVRNVPGALSKTLELLGRRMEDAEREA